jgi:predicted RNA-binding Zn ribbon-like protein
VQLNPYGLCGADLAVDLVRRPPHSVAALTALAEAHTLELPRRIARSDVSLVVDRLVPAIVAVLDAPSAARRTDALNDLLGWASTRPIVTAHDGQPHLHFREDHASAGVVFSAVTSAGLALWLTERGLHRLGRCAAAGCDIPWVDRSRAGRQRYCSPVCANRDAVRRHRERARGGGPTLARAR